MAEKKIIITIKDNIEIIKLNRPNRKNAFDKDMYIQLTSALNEAASNDNIWLTVLTGEGDYYSSGNDLNMSSTRFSGNIENVIEESKQVLRLFVEAFIQFPKILIAIVNGPAIGIAATTLALCDLVFASNNAFFSTPFTRLGLVAEGCSSYTFPKILGRRKATEMLFFNYKMSSEEALQLGFVNDVFKPEEIQSKVWKKIEDYSHLPRGALLQTKRIMKDYEKDELILANKIEVEELANRWVSEDFLNMLSAHANRKSKI